MVYILLGEGFEEAEAIVPADLLRRAGVDVRLTALEGETVTSSHGITVRADCALEEVETEEMEMLVIPGGLGGVESIQLNLFAMALIQKACDKGAYVAAICAAPTILTVLGVLDRRKAVCYPGMEDEMGSAVIHKGCPVVEDGRFITGEAAGSAFDFGLKLVEVLRGKEEAQRVRRQVHYHGHGHSK